MDGKQRGPSTESLLSLGLDIVKIDVARLVQREIVPNHETSESGKFAKGSVESVCLRKGQLNRHTRYRPATTTRNTGQTGAVTAVAPLGGLILSLSGVKSSQVKSSVNALRL
jgi:hypothetical protein